MHAWHQDGNLSSSTGRAQKGEAALVRSLSPGCDPEMADGEEQRCRGLGIKGLSRGPSIKFQLIVELAEELLSSYVDTVGGQMAAKKGGSGKSGGARKAAGAGKAGKPGTAPRKSTIIREQKSGSTRTAADVSVPRDGKVTRVSNTAPPPGKKPSGGGGKGK